MDKAVERVGVGFLVVAGVFAAVAIVCILLGPGAGMMINMWAEALGTHNPFLTHDERNAGEVETWAVEWMFGGISIGVAALMTMVVLVVIGLFLAWLGSEVL